MSVKAPISAERADKANDRFERQIARIYVLWLVGIVVGAIGLKPEKAELGGIAFSLSNPDVLQGLIFVVCILYYVAVIAYLIAYLINNSFTNIQTKRRMLYASLGPKKSFKNQDAGALLSTKLRARIYLTLGSAFYIAYFIIPFFHIVFFERTPLFRGIDTIFHTSSVRGDHIDLYSPPALIGTLFLLLIWTSLIARIFRSYFSKGMFRRSIEVNVASGITYALLEFFFTGRQGLQQIIARITSLQLFLFVGTWLVFGTIAGLGVWHVWALAKIMLRRKTLVTASARTEAPQKSLTAKTDQGIRANDK